jgi:plastocyanin
MVLHKKAFLGLGVAAVVIAAGGAVVLSQQKNQDAVVETAPSLLPSASASPTVSANEVVVRLTASGFEPQQVTITVGQTVVFVTDIKARISSDPHPIHTSDQELNLPETQPGESIRVTPTKTGTFGIHNHLDSSQKMTINVVPK